MISVLILTFNEEQNISACLESVKWSDDVLVLDSFSTDQTVELAKSAGARVMQKKFVNFAEQRNFGLIHGELRHDWVLHLDADERVSPELLPEMFDTIKDGRRFAYQIALKVMFMGCWLRHAGLYPSYQVRLGHRNKLRFVQVGHGQRENLQPEFVGRLKGGLIHYSFSKGLHDWFEKHNRYSSDEVRHHLETETERVKTGALFSADPVRRRRALKQFSFHLPFRPSFRFAYMYFLRLGFLDGRAGFYYCRLLAAYELMIALKFKEHSEKSGK
jgi:glycosyltransferase involved in cell wall biosynthesis